MVRVERSFAPAVLLCLAVTFSGCKGRNEPAKHTISGTVSGAVADGVTVTLGGAGSATAVTSGGGHYAFTDLADGSYTVTPSLAGHTFSPQTLAVSVGGADVPGRDFTALASTHSISGTVSGAVADGVTVTLGGAASATAVTSGGGHYAFVGLADGSYTVTAERSGYTFTPPSHAVALAGADSGGRDFVSWLVGHALSGTVTGAPDGATVTLGGAASATATTAGGGHYAFTGLADGGYTLTPSLSGYAFAPQTLAVTLAGADVGGQDFTGTALGFVVSGTVTGVTHPAEVRLSGAQAAVATTDSGGTYRFTGLPGGSYHLEVWDWVCEPVTRDLTLSADATGQDFACATKCVDLPYSGFINVPSAETVDGKAWFFGGYANGSFQPTIRSFDVATSTWTTAAFAMPYGFADASGGVAQYANGHFYVTPGFAAGQTNGWGSHNRIIDVDLAAGTASEGATVPYGGAIWDMLSGAAGGKLYFLGGHNGADQVGIFEYVPGAATMTRVANMAYAHRGGNVTLGADGKLYIMGQSAQIERFDPVARTVETLRAQMPAEAVGFGGTSAVWRVPAESAIYFTPGVYTGSKLDPRVYKLDYAADTMTDTGAVLPGWVAGNSVWNVGFRDGRFPHVGFYVQGPASAALYRLCRARLPVR